MYSQIYSKIYNSEKCEKYENFMFAISTSELRMPCSMYLVIVYCLLRSGQTIESPPKSQQHIDAQSSPPKPPTSSQPQ
jgi:hypothetical protein